MNRHTLQIIVIIVIFFISVRGVSQTYVYLDENSKEVSSQAFYQKCNSSHLYNCLSYKNDDIVLSKIQYTYQFGKMSSEEYNQLRQLIHKDANISIDSNQTVLIKKHDSLFDFEHEVILHQKHEEEYRAMKRKIDSINLTATSLHKYRYRPHQFNKEIFDEIVLNWINYTNRCIKKYSEKFEVKFVFVHNDSKILEDHYQDFKWVKDRGVFKTTFFAYPKIHNTVILKPDGEYFLFNSHFQTRHIKKLLKNNDWSKYKEDFKKTLEKKHSNGKGIFKVDHTHPKRCF